MIFFVRALNIALVYMGVDLRGVQADMAQHLLHRAQVRPALHQVAGEGMAE